MEIFKNYYIEYEFEAEGWSEFNYRIDVADDWSDFDFCLCIFAAAYFFFFLVNV